MVKGLNKRTNNKCGIEYRRKSNDNKRDKIAVQEDKFFIRIRHVIVERVNMYNNRWNLISLCRFFSISFRLCI